MKLLILLVVVLLTTVAAGIALLKNPGYILIAFDGWSIETTLSIFVLAIFLGYSAFYYSVRFLGGTYRLPKRYRHWRDVRQVSRARMSFDRGMLAYTEGRWRLAERSLTRHVKHAETPLLNYIYAAFAAQHQGNVRQRDYYLRKALKAAPNAGIAIGLTTAQLLLDQAQQAQALETLKQITLEAPDHPQANYLLAQLYWDTQAWWELRAILPNLRKNANLQNDQRFRQLEIQVYTHLLESCDAKVATGVADLRNAWNWIPKAHQERPDVVYLFCKKLAQSGAVQEAEQLLRKTIQKHWDDRLVRLYGSLSGADANAQLKTAEQWLKGREKDPELLLCVGRLSFRVQLWGKARSYLETSVLMRPSADAYKELAALLEKLDDKKSALEYYRTGLTLALQRAEEPTMVATKVSIQNVVHDKSISVGQSKKKEVNQSKSIAELPRVSASKG